MPELPEVETIARYLREGHNGSPAILGFRFQQVSLPWARTLATPSVAELQAALPGQTIDTISRRAKYLVFTLSSGFLLVHLRMSGDVRVEQADVEPQRHDRALFTFDNGWRAAFNDARKFGRIWYTTDLNDILGNLGPEPLDPVLQADDFYQLLHARRRQLKPLLLDQTFLAGVGNIYSDEALHLAKLHPTRLSDGLTPDEASRLLNAIRAVLEEGIRRNGASIDWVYRGGDFQNSFRVYQRTGQACPVCGTPIVRLVVGQRGTHICPYCQQKP